MKHIIKLNSFFLFIILACAAFPLPAALASGLCDGCPLQELCSDTTAGVEVLSCDNNAASAAPPATMDVAAALINEEAASANDTSAVAVTQTSSAPATAENSLPQAAAASTTETAINSPFSMLTAYATSGEVSLILTIKGDGIAVESLIPRLTDGLGLKNNAGNGCELLITTSSEVTLKIDNAAVKEKFAVIESLGIKIVK
ncbi:MAG: hypothetical protein A2008_09995 [Candidatus Wallbacteria bacterium GWC2_49_35]|uniref:HMA domain-containing protein n=1 Tax=Candidatus Wallbacteria bacterium GWC2_49_35 TaxID=1817813 RepID=A0A1F7WLD0_9BACT|nr:MAG: hypothetical protein A2008_09995 [Candidatus Wallbacteria bacterium GWC2_49_35]HBC74914.1 hypothetical protein [Candidatus Wallbacteria bacterium]